MDGADDIKPIIQPTTDLPSILLDFLSRLEQMNPHSLTPFMLTWYYFLT